MAEEQQYKNDKGLSVCSPPLSLEVTLDLLIGLSAHDSNNEAQRQYGKHIYEQFIPKLLEYYREESRHYQYLVNLTAVISGTMRGFSVVRSIYGGRIKSFEKDRDFETQAANRLLQYSPLSGDNIFGKVFSALSGIGLVGLLATALQTFIPLINFVNIIGLLLVGLVGIPIGLIFMDLILLFIWTKRIRQIKMRYPEAFYEDWQKYALSKYIQLSKTFVKSVSEIEMNCYGYSTIKQSLSDEVKKQFIEKLVKKHFPLA